MRISYFKTSRVTKRRSVGLQLWVGRLWARVTKSIGGKRDFEVRTPNAVAGVRGTEFVVDVSEQGQTQVTVVEGGVELGSRLGDGSQTLGANDRGNVAGDGNITRERVEPQEINDMRETVEPEAKLDEEGAKERVAGAGEDKQRGPDGAGERRDGQADEGDTEGDGDGEGGDDSGAGDDGTAGGDEGLEEDLENDRELGSRDEPQTEAPLDLDPGAGQTRVRGRLEVRE